MMVVSLHVVWIALCFSTLCDGDQQDDPIHRGKKANPSLSAVWPETGSLPKDVEPDWESEPWKGPSFPGSQPAAIGEINAASMGLLSKKDQLAEVNDLFSQWGMEGVQPGNKKTIISPGLDTWNSNYGLRTVGQFAGTGNERNALDEWRPTLDARKQLTWQSPKPIFGAYQGKNELVGLKERRRSENVESLMARLHDREPGYDLEKRQRSKSIETLMARPHARGAAPVRDRPEAKGHGQIQDNIHFDNALARTALATPQSGNKPKAAHGQEQDLIKKGNRLLNSLPIHPESLGLESLKRLMKETISYARDLQHVFCAHHWCLYGGVCVWVRPEEMVRFHRDDVMREAISLAPDFKGIDTETIREKYNGVTNAAFYTNFGHLKIEFAGESTPAEDRRPDVMTPITEKEVITFSAARGLIRLANEVMTSIFDPSHQSEKYNFVDGIVRCKCTEDFEGPHCEYCLAPEEVNKGGPTHHHGP